MKELIIKIEALKDKYKFQFFPDHTHAHNRAIDDCLSILKEHKPQPKGELIEVGEANGIKVYKQDNGVGGHTYYELSQNRIYKLLCIR